ncbi:unnamed protein product [Cylindrotheca closterium]|uniref:Kinesin light chain n=1 Tax=Cylindrotheca closterium TaxID=2856 RepID=A0AAD2FNU9_9STRA|nr:unnamed protein product [Cylindrotheca closterium]
MQGSSVEKILREGHDAYLEQGNHKKAKEIFERVLKTQIKELGEDDLSVAKTLSYIGDMLSSEEIYSEAFEKFEKALEIQLEKLGEKHPDTVFTYENIGRAFLGRVNTITANAKHKFAEATKVQRHVLTTLLHVHGEDHPGVVKSYNLIALLLQNQKRSDDALQMLDKSIEICSRLQGLCEISKMDLLGRAFLTKASCFQALGNLEGATEMFTNLLQVQKEALGEMHPATALGHTCLANAYGQRGMLQDGIKANMKANAIYRTSFGDGHPCTEKLVTTIQSLKRDEKAKTLVEQGVAMKAQGHSEKAEQFFHQALDICVEAFSDPQHVPHIAASYENLSHIKVEQGLLEDGIAASVKALKIRRRTLGDDHIDTRKRMDVHRSLLKRLLEDRS